MWRCSRLTWHILATCAAKQNIAKKKQYSYKQSSFLIFSPISMMMDLRCRLCTDEATERGNLHLPHDSFWRCMRIVCGLPHHSGRRRRWKLICCCWGFSVAFWMRGRTHEHVRLVYKLICTRVWRNSVMFPTGLSTVNGKVSTLSVEGGQRLSTGNWFGKFAKLASPVPDPGVCLFHWCSLMLAQLPVARKRKVSHFDCVLM